ncbi:cytochrome c oxidase subunit 7A-related protein, mitochondrial isoform X2 [Eptesicus fuscus]|uniref:cytochrome c oxidase subunit 7A-related protein, mitochondrial isoform X2 n=1 Tax=Eptesicus fuscus TaxID=29078 RepID=UPI002403A84D|nr:cytochrome c oxidase subunit 7A-related protein, mitochondrial isoform X2 [Eptesicus fuscus]
MQLASDWNSKGVQIEIFLYCVSEKNLKSFLGLEIPYWCISSPREEKDSQLFLETKGLKPVVSTEAPPIIFATPTKLTSDYPTYDYAGKNKVPELQKFFQKSDGVPIHLKRGLPDQMLYRTTMALTLGGTIYCLIALYMASQPRNK